VRRVSNELATSSAERLRELGVDAQRVDGIGFGARVFEALLDRLGIEALRISSRGLREGLLLREFSGSGSAAVEMGGLALRRTDRNLGV
jgi:exopolyphosphatase/pppGpp-phosphohydrolase